MTGIGFGAWGLIGEEHHHHHHHENHVAGSGIVDRKGPGDGRQSRGGRLAAIVVPFGAAASPDLTVLPVALAASGIGLAAVGGVLATFSAATLSTFVVLTVGATIAGYQIKGEWLEHHGMTITGIVLSVIGIAVFVGL